MCSICGEKLVRTREEGAPPEDWTLVMPECNHFCHPSCFINRVHDLNYTCSVCNKSIVSESTLKKMCQVAKLSLEGTSHTRSINSFLQQICEKAHEDVVYLRQWIITFHFLALFGSLLLRFVFFVTDKTLEDALGSHTFLFYSLFLCLFGFTCFEVKALQLLINKLQS